MNQGFAENGKYFGYPQCCIDYFITNSSTERNPSWNKTGFIPCPNCLKTVNDVDGLARLIVGRECEKPFPQSK